MENRGISLMIRGVNDDFSFDKKNEMDIKMKKSGNGKNLSLEGEKWKLMHTIFELQNF